MFDQFSESEVRSERRKLLEMFFQSFSLNVYFNVATDNEKLMF